MRDLMFAFLMVLAIPLAIARPVNAYLLWGWTAVVVPTSYFYGFMADARLNLFFGILTITLVLVGRVPWTTYLPNRVTWLYLLFLMHGTASFLLGYPSNPHNAQYYEFFVKGLLFCLAMPFFVRERMHLHAAILVIVLGFGLHGVLNGLKTLASGGGHNVIGPVGTMIDDRNHLSTALALSLPLIYYLYQHSQSRWIRLGFLGGFALVALAIAGSGSRGGFIALAVVSGWLVVASRQRWRIMMLLGVLGLLFVSFAPDQWTDRLATIENAAEDQSFMGRVIAWKVSSAIAVVNPVFGGGFHAVQAQAVWDQFKTSPGLLGFLDLPVPTFNAKAAHSIYFEVMGDLGFVGLILFLAILVHGVYSRFAIKREIAKLGAGWHWARDMADMLMLAIVAYMVGGAAVSLGYFEVVYMVVMLMEMLRLHVKRAAAARAIPKGAKP